MELQGMGVPQRAVCRLPQSPKQYKYPRLKSTASQMKGTYLLMVKHLPESRNQVGHSLGTESLARAISVISV